ncbi:MAG: hypothetical protein AAFV53_23835 [Myxococcota bacterium]
MSSPDHRPFHAPLTTTDMLAMCSCGLLLLPGIAVAVTGISAVSAYLAAAAIMVGLLLAWFSIDRLSSLVLLSEKQGTRSIPRAK